MDESLEFKDIAAFVDEYGFQDFEEIPDAFQAFEALSAWVDRERKRRKRNAYLAERREYYYKHQERYKQQAKARYQRKKEAKKIRETEQALQPVALPAQDAVEQV